ncbi:hypothetical protein [Mesoterricola silvestris]|uniref:SWIM-type domain-containing protein n=1 Tax=Mesoterricola silvestris TaxID=2927979 RepID=A0AA48KA15_9BACT|nr:hypothetical protein [Mesoterricola silvestris]BDU74539.1 hypothetical protein METEAL_37130 [Mesoterricola silvestris]
MGFLSRFQSVRPDDGKDQVIRDQAAKITELQDEVGRLRTSQQPTRVVYQAWKPGPPSRTFNLSAVSFACEWATPCLHEIPPELKRTFEVRSFSIDSDKVYTVDLGAHSCTCPDFLKRRENLPLGHALRCCKHITRVIRDTGLFEGQDELTRRVLDAGGDPATIFLLIQFPGYIVTLAITPGQEWVNLWAPKKATKGPGEIELFGYNQAEKRWSYGKPPYQPIPIKAAIDGLLCGRAYA